MPGKRSYFRRALSLQCPYCNAQIHRLNSQKYSLYLDEAGSIAKLLGISQVKAQLLAQQGPVLDKEHWLEEFYCTDHGRMWLQIKRQSPDGGLCASVPDPSVWKRSLRTVDPDHPNPSVSEFSLRNSRNSHHNLDHRFHQR